MQSRAPAHPPYTLHRTLDGQDLDPVPCRSRLHALNQAVSWRYEGDGVRSYRVEDDHGTVIASTDWAADVAELAGVA